MPRKDFRTQSHLSLAGVCWLLLLALLRLCTAEAVKAQGRLDPPAPPGDIAVATLESGEVTIFWADTEGGAIYSKRVTEAAPAEVALKDFSVFFRSPELPAPSALAYRGGKLYVCDAKAVALYEIDVESGSHRVLLKAPVLQMPTAVAVSERGEIAVSNGPSSRVIWYDPGKGQTLPAVSWDGARSINAGDKFSGSRRMVYAGSELLALVNENGIVSSDPGLEIQGRQLVESFQGRKVFRNFGEVEIPGSDHFDEAHKKRGGGGNKGISDFTYYRGIYYLTDGRRILAYTHKGGLVIPLPRATPTQSVRIASSEYRLFVADGARKTLYILPRPVPVKLSFESVSGSDAEELASAHRDALASLYLYLASRNILPTRVHVAPHDFTSMHSLLVEQKVLFPSQDESDSVDPLTASARQKFARLLCDLNRDYCAALSILAGDPLSQKVPKGQRIRLPRVAFAGDLISGSVDLKGKSVKEHLKDRVSAAQRKKISPKDLLQLNADFKNTFEGYLAGKRYILADALKGELQVGSVVRFEKEREVKLGDVQKCSFNLRQAAREEVIKHPPVLTSRAVENVLPWQPGQVPQSAGELQKLGVSEVDVSFDKLTNEWLPFEEFLAGLGSIYQMRCLERYEKQYVVSRALKAKGTRYTLRRDDGTTVSLGEEELRRLKLLGQPDPTGESSFVVNEPLYFGYQLLQGLREFEDYPPDVEWREVTDYRDVKPNSPQNIFNQTEGVFELPVTRWRADLFVNAEDLRRDSGLRQLTSWQGIYVLSEQESSLVGSAVAFGVRIPQGANTLEEFRRQRAQLKERISYVPPTDDLFDIKIGVGEDEKSIDFYHPDFYDEKGNAWYRLTENKQNKTKDWAAVPKPAAASALAKPLSKDFSEKDDHGSHVAGLLAARKNGVAGLLPDAELFLINNSSVAALEESVEAAIKRGIYIFNFSFTTKVQGDDTFSDIRKKMSTESRWQQRLFVVAAGNDNKYLRYLPERFPISWADKEANILGVGASDGNNNFLGQWTPDPQHPDRVMAGSNWGKEYVHLLAPGKEVWSTASGNRYAVATGTSMAVPQVTAAAAMLLGQGLSESAWIKLRLLYTADWFSPQFDDKVWGGQLNYRRAVWQPFYNLLSTQSAPLTYSAVEFDENAELEVLKGEMDDRRGDRLGAPKKILLKNVLRIQRLGQPSSGLFNVVYLEDDNVKRLRVLRNAQLSGEVACRWTREWNAAAKDFGAKKQNCKVMDVSSTFYDYVARVPRERHDTITF